MTTMATGGVTVQSAALDRKESTPEYNFTHFRAKHLLQDALRTINKEGIAPGELAPDFELPLARGGSLRLSGLRGKPAVLHFGSYT